MKTMFAFIMGLLVGALAASAVSLMMAPMTGKKMRKRVMGQAEDLQEAALERAIEIQKDAQKLLKKQNKKLAKQAMGFRDNAMDTAADLQDRGQKVLKERSKTLFGKSRKVLDRMSM